MKHLKEKDLSLDKQVVSDLSGGSDTRDETNNELICASTVCTDSQFELCCDETVKICPTTVPNNPSVDVCIATNDTLCEDCTAAPGCKTPYTEGRGC